MKETEQRGENRVPIALRIKLRFRKIDTFVSKFATNISANGMFISSRKPKEQGTLLRFELRLADDSTVISGQGKVAWVREFDPDHPKRPHGMGIAFTTLSAGSRELINQIVAQRVEQGLGEADEIPFAAKRRTPPSPLPPPEHGQALAGAEPATPASPAAQSAPIAEPPSSGVPTMALEDIETVEVDLRAAVARARALVGSVELDDELEQLYRVSAAPAAETVDEASNDLARMLGGQAVLSKRIRYSDPPTGVEISAAPAAPDEESDDDSDDALDSDGDSVDDSDDDLDSVVAALAAEAAHQAGSSENRYPRAETDPSPDIIGEFDASDGAAKRISEATFDPMAVVDGNSPTRQMATREAPMHLDASNEESLDIDIDEATPSPEPDPELAQKAPAPQSTDVALVDVAASPDDDDNDFSEGANNSVDLTDLIDLPPHMESADEIDLDFD